MNNQILNDAEFIFIKSGNVYIIQKDKYGWLSIFFAVDKKTVDSFLSSEYKTTILDIKGNILMKNFGYDLEGAKNFLMEAEQEYNQKLDAIDRALAEGDKDLFMQITNELYH